MQNASEYFMPAEWENHEATWLSWPVNTNTWPGEKLAAAEKAFMEMIFYLSGSEKVRINFLGEKKESDRIISGLIEANVNLDNVSFYPNRSNDAWCRDHGPIFVYDRQGRKTVLNWKIMHGAENIPLLMMTTGSLKALRGDCHTLL